MRLVAKITAAAVLASLPVLAQGAQATPQVHRAVISYPVRHDVSKPLRQLATGFHLVPSHLVTESPAKPVPGPAGLRDTVQQAAATTAARATIVHNYDGLGDGYQGFSVNALPPDTVGAVGRTQYVQWVNSGFVVLNKATGKPELGPANGNTLWKGFGGECEKENDGDPVVTYDRFADRWVLQQFAVTNGNYECFAISKTPDATGAYYRYAYQYTGFNDYPKSGVWSNAYVNTYNMFNAESGTKVCAFERAAMLTGDTARQACVQLNANQPALLPADADGNRAPGAGEDVPLLGLGTNALQMFAMHVDWQNPAQTRLAGPTALPVAGFTPACIGYDVQSRVSSACVPQPGTGAVSEAAPIGLDPLSDRPMFRLAWRKLAHGTEAMAVTHSVDAFPLVSAAIRWYELTRRGSSGAWKVDQQGTYLPDNDSRWMGSVAMDKKGGLAIGYSVSGPTLTFPSIRVAGRTASDPKGTLSKETVVVDGSGEQATASYISRWGDYSAMSIDPVDDCTFWYTTEYMKQTGIFNWNTKVVAFRLPGCH